jgi:hypothetical protein
MGLEVGRLPQWQSQSGSTSWIMPPPPLRINKKSLIKVGLIRQLWCFLEGYISKAPPRVWYHISSTDQKLGFQFFIQVEEGPSSSSSSSSSSSRYSSSSSSCI